MKKKRKWFTLGWSPLQVHKTKNYAVRSMVPLKTLYIEEISSISKMRENECQ